MTVRQRKNKCWQHAMMMLVFLISVIANGQELSEPDPLPADAVTVDNKSARSWDAGVLLQLDGNRFDGVYRETDPSEWQNDTYVRRSLLLLKGKWSNWSIGAVLSANRDVDADNRLIQLQIKHRHLWPGAEFKIGKIKEEIGLEALSSSRHSLFISRSMLSDVGAPYFSWGAAYNQTIPDWDMRWSLGRYRNEAFGGAAHDVEGESHFANTARLSYAPWRRKGKVLHIGYSYTDREAGVGDQLRLSHNGEVREAEVKPLSYSRGGKRWELDAMQQRAIELAAQMGAWHVALEQLQRKVDVTVDGLPAHHQFDARTALIAWAVTGESRKYQFGSGTFGGLSHEGDAIQWELLLRYSDFDARSDTQGTAVKAGTVGANIYFSEHWQLQANFIESRVRGPGTDATESDNPIAQGRAWSLRLQLAW